MKSPFWADQTLAFDQVENPNKQRSSAKPKTKKNDCNLILCENYNAQESGTLQNFVSSSLIGKTVTVTYNCKGGKIQSQGVKLTEKSTYNMVVSDDGAGGLKAGLVSTVYCFYCVKTND